MSISNPTIGEITIFGGDFPPKGWAFCDGQLLLIAQNTALFSILGTTYGGDERTTFALPDLRGRALIGPRNGPGLSDYRLGQKGGQQTNTLNVNQIPSHNHAATGTIKASSSDGTTNKPTGNILAAGKTALDRSNIVDANIYSSTTPNTNMAANEVAVTVANTGGNQPINNLQPFLAVNYIIALVGIFPSRD